MLWFSWTRALNEQTGSGAQYNCNRRWDCFLTKREKCSAHVNTAAYIHICMCVCVRRQKHKWQHACMSEKLRWRCRLLAAGCWFSHLKLLTMRHTITATHTPLACRTAACSPKHARIALFVASLWRPCHIRHNQIPLILLKVCILVFRLSRTCRECCVERRNK